MSLPILHTKQSLYDYDVILDEFVEDSIHVNTAYYFIYL